MNKTASEALENDGKFAATKTTPAADRTVSAGELHARLAVAGASAELNGCIVRGAIDISERSVGHLTLRDCTLESFDARDADFTGSLELDGSTIGSGAPAPAEGLRLLGTTIGGVLSLRNVTVLGKLDLINCRVRSGLPATGLVVDGDCTAYDLTVDASADFTGAHFRAKADFHNAHIGRTLGIGGATFEGDATFADATAVVLDADRTTVRNTTVRTTFIGKACFAGMNAGSKMSFAGAEFCGDAIFAEAQVVSRLELRGCAVAKKLDLTNVKAHALVLSDRIHGKTVLDGLAVTAVFDASDATFHGPVSGVGARLGVLKAERSTFGDVRLTDLVIDAGASFGGAQFEGPFSLAGGRIGGNLDCEGAAFGRALTLETVSVTGSASFTSHAASGPGDVDRTGTFGGDVEFSGVSIGYHLRFESLAAHGVAIDLTGTHVGGDLTLERLHPESIDLSGASVSGDITMSALQCEKCALENVTVGGDVTMCGDANTHQQCEFGTMDLYGTTISGTLSVLEATIAECFKAKFVTVGRDVDFRGSHTPAIDVNGGTIGGRVKLGELAAPFPPRILFTGAKVGAIDVTGAIARADAATRERLAATTFDLADCAYDYLVCDPRLLVERFADPNTNRQPYLQLEAMLRKRGFDTEADDVYASGRRNTKSPPGTSGWIRDVVAESVAGYGVSFTRIIWIVAVTFVFGWLYFAAVPGATRLTTPAPSPSAAPSGSPAASPSPVAVPPSPPGTLAEAAAAADPACAKPVRAGLLPGGWIAFQAVVPAAFPNSGWAVADDCPVFGLPTWTFAFTMFVVLVLKLVEWTLLPVLLLMVTGVIRPAASA